MTKVAQFFAESVSDINKKLDMLGLDSRDVITIVDRSWIFDALYKYSVFYHEEVNSDTD